MLDIACFAGALMTCAQEVPLSKDIKGQDLLLYSRQIGTSRSAFTRKGELAIWTTVGRISVTDKLSTNWLFELDMNDQPEEDPSFLSGESDPIT
jgi:hypothetical protein